MNNFFSDTLVDISFRTPAQKKTTDEHPFIADLYNDEIVDVGHIHLVPLQNRICLTAATANGEQKSYNIKEPRLEFLKFVFDNSNIRVKKAIRFYFQNSNNAQNQRDVGKKEE